MLTDAAIRKAKPSASAQKLTDGGGMYLLLKPDGGRYWRLDYRFANKRKTLALGVYPTVTLADARLRRDEARRKIANNIDPGAERKEAKAVRAVARVAADNTFASVARAWMERQDIAEVTANKNKWILEGFLFPELGEQAIAGITSRMLLDALRKIEASGKLETARRAKVKVGQVFRYAVIEGLVDTDPTAALKGALKAPKQKHHAAITDPARIGALLRSIDGYSGQFATLKALQLAPLVFVRPGELRAAEWAEFDLDEGMWRIPPARMKMKAPHLVPLSSQAVSVLRDVRALSGEGRFVFPGLRSALRPMSENTINAALRGLGYSGDEMTGHGFRSMAATRLNEMGWNADAIERQLAHAETNKVREAYTHAAQYLDVRKRMMQAWADYLDGLRVGGQIVPIRRIAS
ncbi:integrase [Luteibacter sp. OK325]|uniref:tyrosine-type recombinase/integrase n=1 Tax=Luteibacter sp. OK325 TaxID=2135670 RepID=UPI000D353131|nr:integrase arm-type DNA-binding domain-containing protein [Luteibacter sp. OK325]PTR33034.1 integrase [Luteibacter sp. OK325]